ncbi:MULTISPECIES: universal stress protein [Schaalia]|uniref:Universal stress protein n=1 Tax=Schaalia canis TaxID=100469 RepID=A0A3P1SFD5_9ACTO|nr:MULTISPECIES: universal stress protein [Schaalia]RRC95868.1 universal stress protein [Schaalia canis]
MTKKPYSTIVVGTDGSSLAPTTIASAAHVAVAEDADLVIVCAYSSLPRRTDAMNQATLGGEVTFDQVPGVEAATLALDEAVAQAEKAGARVKAAELIDGPAAASLLHSIETHEADLLVMGAIRDRSIAGRLLGTVAQELAGKAPCDVLIIRPLPDTPEPSRPEDVTL